MKFDTSTALRDNVHFVRQQFPALERPAIFLDNPAGTQISRHSLERMNQYMIECNANHGGMFETSRKSDEVLHEAHNYQQANLNKKGIYPFRNIAKIFVALAKYE